MEFGGLPWAHIAAPAWFETLKAVSEMIDLDLTVTHLNSIPTTGVVSSNAAAKPNTQTGISLSHSYKEKGQYFCSPKISLPYR
jgi:hypothetical protein